MSYVYSLLCIGTPLVDFYSQTFEKRSSAPPNPPADFELVVAVVVEDTGAALVQPPKSSSAATVGVGLAVEDVLHPLLISLAVKVSGILIMLDVEGPAGAGVDAGTGSGVPQALLPQGSMLAVIALAVAADTAGAAGLERDGDRIGGLFRLNAELISC